MNQLLFQTTNNLTFDTVECERQRFLDSLILAVQHTICKIDLSTVTQCDSAGLALLIEAKRLCNQRQIELQVCGMPDFMRFLAEFSNIDSFF